MNQKSIAQFYLHAVLPSLFENLDRSFSEFAWSRTVLGWKGIARQNDDSAGGSIVCNHPWGFVDDQGVAKSWLEFEQSASDCGLVEAVRNLAERAGVDHACLRQITDGDQQELVAKVHGQELLEQFAAYCNRRLTADECDTLQALHDQHGVDLNHVQHLDAGLYETSQEVGEHLVHAGFTHDEIVQSAIAGDARVHGRLIVPWRDHYGQIKTIIARDLAGGSRSNLYLRGGTKTAAFGLDVALRPAAGGRDHLVVVKDVLDVIYFRSIGVLNVAAVTDFDQAVTGWHWQRLARAGVRSVTLAVGNARGSHRKIVDAIKTTHHAGRAPKVYALADSALGECATAAEFVRRHGLSRFQQILKQREHGYRLVANSVVDKYRHGTSWTDVQLLNMLGEAVRFDAEVGDAFRVEQLKQHYWPAILEATGLPWEALRNLLNHREQPKPLEGLGGWQARNLKKLVRDLRHCLRIEDYATFKQLVCDAARDFGGAVQIEPANQQWSQEESKEKAQEILSFVDAASKFPLVNVTSNGSDHEMTSQPVISLSDIRELAYQIWEHNGRPTGEDQRFWYEAEHALGLHARRDTSKSRAAA